MIKMSSNKFTGTQLDNFSITFANGYSVSLAMGGFTYSSASGTGFKTVEVAIIDPNGNFVDVNDAQVTGWQSPDDVLALMNKAAGM